MRHRQRTCSSPAPMYGGSLCLAGSVHHDVHQPDTQSEVCNTQLCSGVVNGSYSAWSEWGNCSSSCPSTPSGYYPGTQIRRRSCSSPAPSPTGLSCLSQHGAASDVERRACNTEFCVATARACPGSSLSTKVIHDHNGNPVTVRERECSGHGSCARQPLFCSDSVGCAAWCECEAGYSGTGCEFTQGQHAARQGVRGAIALTVAAAVRLMDVTPGAVWMAASTLAAVVGDGDELDQASSDVMLTSIDGLIASASSANHDFIGAEATAELLTALGSLAHHAIGQAVTGKGVEAAAKSVTMKSSALISQLPRHTLVQSVADEAALIISTKRLAVGSKVLQEAEPSVLHMALAGQQVVIPHTAVPLATQLPAVTQAIQWAFNPHGWQTSSANMIPGAVTSVQMVDATGQRVVVRGTGDAAIDIYTPVPGYISADKMSCQYWSPGREIWAYSGVVITGQLYDSVGGRFVKCASVHLTDFSAALDFSDVGYNEVDPVNDAGLLQHYANPQSIRTIILVATMLLIFTVAFCITSRLQVRDKVAIQKEVKRQFLTDGAVGAHKASLQLPPGHTIRTRHEVSQLTPAQARQLGDHPAVNTVENFMSLLWREFKFRLKRDHMWFGIVTTGIAGRARMPRPQRVMALCATCFTSLAVVAMLLSRDPFRVSRLFQTAFLSAACTLPPSFLLPSLFRKVNRFASRTVLQRRKAVLALLGRYRANDEDEDEGGEGQGAGQGEGGWLSQAASPALRPSPGASAAWSHAIARRAAAAASLRAVEEAGDDLAVLGAGSGDESGSSDGAATVLSDVIAGSHDGLAPEAGQAAAVPVHTPPTQAVAAEADGFKLQVLPDDDSVTPSATPAAQPSAATKHSAAMAPSRTPPARAVVDMQALLAAPPRSAEQGKGGTQLWQLLNTSTKVSAVIQHLNSRAYPQQPQHRHLSSMVVMLGHLLMCASGCIALAIWAVLTRSVGVQQGDATADWMLLCGCAWLLLSAVAITLSQLQYFAVSAALFVVNVLLEVAIVAVLLITAPEHYGDTLLALAVAQGMVLLVVMAIVYTSMRLSQTIASRIATEKHAAPSVSFDALASLGASSRLVAASPLDTAATRLQAAERGRRGRVIARRRKEIEAWEAVQMERRLLLTFLYFAVLVFLAALVYINLLYGVKFTSDMSAAWIQSALLAFAFSALVSATGIQLAKSIVSVGKALLRKREVHHGFDPVKTPQQKRRKALRRRAAAKKVRAKGKLHALRALASPLVAQGKAGAGAGAGAGAETKAVTAGAARKGVGKVQGSGVLAHEHGTGDVEQSRSEAEEVMQEVDDVLDDVLVVAEGEAAAAAAVVSDSDSQSSLGEEWRSKRWLDRRRRGL